MATAQKSSNRPCQHREGLDLLDDLDGVLVLHHVVLADLLRDVLDAAAPDQCAAAVSDAIDM